MKKHLRASIPMLCLLLAAILPLAVPAYADTQWTLNSITTQLGATISGSFDISYNSNVLLEQLTSWNFTYTPAGGGAATDTFNPGNRSQFGDEIYIPMYNPQNLPFPPPFVTSFVIVTNSANSVLDLNFPIAALPDLGPGNLVPVNQAVCTTANSNPANPGYVPLCDGNTGTGPSYYQAAFPASADLVDPGSVIGTYIAGTPGPTGGGNTGVPEPSTLVLSSLGFAALALKRFWA